MKDLPFGDTQESSSDKADGIIWGNAATLLHVLSEQPGNQYSGMQVPHQNSLRLYKAQVFVLERLGYYSLLFPRQLRMLIQMIEMWKY